GARHAHRADADRGGAEGEDRRGRGFGSDETWPSRFRAHGALRVFTLTSIERTNVLRQVALFLAVAAWAFLLLSLGSFHANDWPSHTVYPWPAIQNLCGSAGAYVAYYCFLAIGQGVFPVLFFSGVLLALMMCKSRVSDVWLRVIGLMLLSTAFAAAVHHIRPGSNNSFPEGHGGLIGLTAFTFLHAHFAA